MKKMLVLSSMVMFYILTIAASSVFALTTWTGTPNQLAQSLVGPGITIKNISYTGASDAIGFFSGGLAAGIGIDKGVVLTNGSISNLNGNSNTSDGITANNGEPGASFLDALIPGYYTYDASILEFDFKSSGSDLYFNYVFGSEEYNEWVGSQYNDVFGFFLDGTGVNDNIAKLPDGTVVSINNINKNSHSSLYNDNDPSDNNPPPYPFEYDGFTDVLTAHVTGLTPNTWHHITLAIADAGDHVLDSGVFIGAGTFSNKPVNTAPEPSTIFLLGLGFIGITGYYKKQIRKRTII